MKKYVFLLSGIAFSVFTIYALLSQDIWAYMGQAASQAWGLHSLIELALLFILAVTWMVKDAKQHSINVLPYLIIILLSGVSGVFFYLWKKQVVLTAGSSPRSKQTATMAVGQH